MKIEGDYPQNGYALVREIIPRQVAQAFMGVIRRRLIPGGVVPAVPQEFDMGVLKRNVFEVYGEKFPPMKTFLWGLTPAMEAVTGKRLVLTYNYFRIYRRDDLCYVHLVSHISFCTGLTPKGLIGTARSTERVCRGQWISRLRID